MTERHEILEMMAELKLSGMRASYDEVVTTGVKRSQGIERILASLLKAEIAGDCQEFRVRAGMMGAKEPRHAETQRAEDP